MTSYDNMRGSLLAQWIISEAELVYAEREGPGSLGNLCLKLFIKKIMVKSVEDVFEYHN